MLVALDYVIFSDDLIDKFIEKKIRHILENILLD